MELIWRVKLLFVLRTFANVAHAKNMARGKRIACSLYGNIYKNWQWETDSDKRWRYARCNRKKVVVFNYHEHSSYKNIMKADD